MRTQLITEAKRVVVKIGSSLVASPKDGLRLEHIDRLVKELCEVRQTTREVVLVSSGAIVAGIEKLGLKAYPGTLTLKQAAAAAGQSQLIHSYEHAFHKLGQKVAQVLLTHQDLANRKRFLNARHTLTTLLTLDVIPIINENDTVSVEEIRFGDNDSLAGQVAQLVDADLLIILSDVDGLFTQDPRLDPTATLIPSVQTITPDIERGAGTSRSQESTGGMVTKIQAAKLVGSMGIPTLLLNGEIPNLMPHIFNGHLAGTFFFPRTDPSKNSQSSRKQWIRYTLRPKGHILLDAGAVDALTHRGKSLLPSGIIAIRGDFWPGDLVKCTNETGKAFAQGLVNFSATDLRKIMGAQTEKIGEILGNQEYEEVIHRDNLVLL